MILFRTLLNRNMWANPLSNVMGNWGLHNSKGELSTEPIENLMLTFNTKILKKKHSVKNVLWQSAKIVFLFSLAGLSIGLDAG